MKSIILLTILVCSCSLSNSKIERNPKSELKTHYEVYGKGTPILIINGGPGMSSEGFRPLAKHLGKNYKAIIYDQRGTGKSKIENPNHSNISLDLMVEDIETLRKELKIEKWYVLGHSFGGMLGSYYATKHPERIEGLILSASGGIDMELFDVVSIRGRLSKEDRDSLEYYEKLIAEGDTSFQTKFSRGRHLAPAYLYKKEFVDQIAVRFTQSNLEINSLVFQSMRKMNFDCAEDLKKFKQPTLIIQGEEDIIPISISKKALKTIPNSKLKLIPECAHYPWLEQPDFYFKHLQEFIQ